MPYFSGQGKVFIGDRTAGGDADVLRWVGDASAINLSFETDVLEWKESWSGQRATALRLLREKTASLALTLHEFDSKNLALALFGDDGTNTGSSVVDESLAGGSVAVAVGDFLRLAHADVSALVVKDSAGSPATLVLDTDYRIESAKHGSIEVLNLGAYTQPFTADYTYADSVNIRMLTQGLSEKWVRLEGLNSADSDGPVLIELYRVAFDPGEELAWIGDEVFEMVLNGSSLIDSDKQADALLGPFGRVVQITA